MNKYILDLKDVNMSHVPTVGGKNASLGEMIQHLSAAGVRIPGGFATTAQAYADFLNHHDLQQRIVEKLDQLNVENITQLITTGQEIREWVRSTTFPLS